MLLYSCRGCNRAMTQALLSWLQKIWHFSHNRPVSNRSTIHIRFDLGLSGFNTNRQKGGVIFKVQLRANSFPQLSFYMGEGEANNDCIVTPPTDELVQRTHTRNHASVTWCTPLPLPRRGAVNPMGTDTHTHTRWRWPITAHLVWPRDGRHYWARG